MRPAIWIAVFCLLTAGSVLAGNVTPGPGPTVAKGDGHVRTREAFDLREGGEDVTDAVVIPALPYLDSGATCDNLDDYEEQCPYQGWAPDVVYAYTAAADDILDIDLCGSLYDTKVFVYENQVTPGSPHACNDDYYGGPPCGLYVSRIDYMPVAAGNTYYIVIDGYGADCGEYQLSVAPRVPAELECPTGALLEGEPPLEDQYNDQHNSGCGGHPDPLFQPILGQGDGCATMCAVSGWYLYNGANYRDTDWFEVAAAGTEIEWTIIGEFPINQFVILPDCMNLELLIVEQVDAMVYNTVSFPTQPGEIFWLWVGPQTFTGPVNEFDYIMDVCGIMDDPIPVEPASWGGVKALYGR